MSCGQSSSWAFTSAVVIMASRLGIDMISYLSYSPDIVGAFSCSVILFAPLVHVGPLVCANTDYPPACLYAELRHAVPVDGVHQLDGIASGERLGEEGVSRAIFHLDDDARHRPIPPLLRCEAPRGRSREGPS